MKAIKYILLLAAFFPLKSMASADSTAKSYFYVAKQHLEGMLAGKEQMSYEEAIYQIENAWWKGRLRHSTFKAALDFHVGNIERIIEGNTDSIYMNPKRSLLETVEEKRTNYKNALTNYAIYSYMTRKTTFGINGNLLRHHPYQYSYNDPFGTDDWTNTQVNQLLRKNTGNCFALASLFKIFSERLNSKASLCTAPGHIYIRHADEKGTKYNVELSSNQAFPGTGTLETLTYTPDEATKKGIALRELDLKQSIALCLVYLAKGYEYKFGVKDDPFMLACSETALQYDDHNLNAMLLKAEVMEHGLVKQNKTVAQLSAEKEFQDYQNWITHIFSYGYREMPYEMKNIMIKGWTRDTIITLSQQDHTPSRLKHATLKDTRYAGLSWGLFDEEIKTKPLERYGNTVFDTKKMKVVAFLKSDVLYNHYNFDPTVFALNVDPLAHKFPWQSPYSAMDNNPILKCDPTGASGVAAIKGDVIIIHSTNVYYGTGVTAKLAKQDAKNIEATWNAANAVKVINGKTYSVQFKITPQVMSVKDGEAARKANTDVETNYIGVGKYGANTNTNTHSVADNNRNLGGNDFDYNQQDFATGNKSSSHEQGHGWGWFDFGVNGDQYFDKGSGHNDKPNSDGSPNIMQDRNNVDESEWGDRKATQQDVDKLNINWQELGEKGKTNVGEISDHTQ
ncbi:hypothetical protein [Taibaiella soli]|uniref:Transglutaminase-like domain-containing protein n=1 Tax=Taibaiella soli TaxID=1649169 RepID=A0A2W2AD79_9BACT|nr:hypothetical protein [Taibaiella soli]PZF71592.1 hypothetical protein DN068_16080 [Taibaiella soli]